MKVIDAVAITTAGSVTSPVVGSGAGSPGSLLVQIDFVYGSGGTSGKVWLQTSLDGSTWIDIANMTFLLASKSRIYNFSADTPITTAYVITDGTLADDTAKDGIIGEIYRCKYTTVGTYAASTLSVTILPGS
jgi:hypothetical protein